MWEDVLCGGCRQILFHRGIWVPLGVLEPAPHSSEGHCILAASSCCRVSGGVVTGHYDRWHIEDLRHPEWGSILPLRCRPQGGH